jgi:hypothetical protein
LRGSKAKLPTGMDKTHRNYTGKNRSDGSNQDTLEVTVADPFNDYVIHTTRLRSSDVVRPWRRSWSANTALSFWTTSYNLKRSIGCWPSDKRIFKASPDHPLSAYLLRSVFVTVTLIPSAIRKYVGYMSILTRSSRLLISANENLVVTFPHVGSEVEGGQQPTITLSTW